MKEDFEKLIFKSMTEGIVSALRTDKKIGGLVEYLETIELPEAVLKDRTVHDAAFRYLRFRLSHTTDCDEMRTLKKMTKLLKLPEEEVKTAAWSQIHDEQGMPSSFKDVFEIFEIPFSLGKVAAVAKTVKNLLTFYCYGSRQVENLLFLAENMPLEKGMNEDILQRIIAGYMVTEVDDSVLEKAENVLKVTDKGKLALKAAVRLLEDGFPEPDDLNERVGGLPADYDSSMSLKANIVKRMVATLMWNKSKVGDLTGKERKAVAEGVLRLFNECEWDSGKALVKLFDLHPGEFDRETVKLVVQEKLMVSKNRYVDYLVGFFGFSPTDLHDLACARLFSTMVENRKNALAFAKAYGITDAELKGLVGKQVLDMLVLFSGNPQGAVALIEDYQLPKSFLESSDLADTARYALLNAYRRCDATNVTFLKEYFNL